MVKKTIKFDIYIKTSEQTPTYSYTAKQKVMSNDKDSTQITFNLLDVAPEELSGSSASILLYMEDGSFFQKSDVTINRNSVIYTMKPEETRHSGNTKVQIVLNKGTVQTASLIYNFEIERGLEKFPIVEKEIQDWTSLTAEAKAFVEQIKDFTLEGFVENKMGEELANLETNYATRLTGLEQKDNQLTAQLAQKATKTELTHVVSNLDSKATKEELNALGELKLAGEHSTLTALQNKYPNGTEGLHLVISDGYIYRWDSNDWIRSIQFQSAGIADKSIGVSKVDRAIYHSLTDNLIELFDINKVTVGKSYNESGDIVTSSANTTDFIFIPAGSSLIYTVDDENGLNLSGASRLIVEFDTNLNFLNRVRIDSLLSKEYIPSTDRYIRIVYYASDSNISIKNSKTTISKNEIEKVKIDINRYKSDSLIEQFDSNQSTNEAFVLLTGDITPHADYFLTQPIFVPRNSMIFMKFNGVNWKESSVGQSLGTKIGIYDGDSNWEQTLRLNSITRDLIFTGDKYIRLQISKSVNTSIQVEGLRKIDGRMVTGTPSGENGSEGHDVFIFMGQSNMAGRGVQTPEHPELAPDVSDIAYEYRAITAPNQLTPLAEPFGISENTSDGINDGTMKTGSMVSSFAKTYHEVTGKKMIGISASKGATAIHLWQPETAMMNDLINRLNSFKSFAQTEGIKVRNYYVVFNQGEGDASADRDPELYQERLESIVSHLKGHGIAKFFLVRIGYDDVQSAGFLPIIEKQTEMCQTHPDMILVGTEFAQLSKGGYLKDGVHFVQQAYNLQGEQAGRNTAFYIQNQKEPTIYDSEFKELYVSHKH